MRSLRSVESLLTVALVVAVSCAKPSVGLSQDDFQDDLTFEPYSVFVAEEESFAYCGPAEEYYRTDPLRYGQALEVYAETEDGWLGIRPPEDSFCWIPAETVELDQSEEAGTIVEDRTVAWIGTHLGRARTYRWQVQLAKGEPITIIGRSEREGPDGPQLWYRIVPPSGEYRWVHRDSVVMSSEELVESVRRQANHSPQGIASGSKSPSVLPDQPVSPRQQTQEPEATEQDEMEPEAVVSSGPSVLNRDQAIGSGLNEDWRTTQDSSVNEVVQTAAIEEPQSAVDAFKQGGLLASIDFLTRPRIQEIGSQPQTAPSVTEVAADSNWVVGATRAHNTPVGPSSAALGVPVASMNSPGANDRQVWGQVRQVSGESMAANPLPGQTVAPAVHSFNVIPSERISQIEAEVSQADLDRLNLILSRLMAAQASAAETEPVERAAQHLASTSTDSVAVGRARMLAETAERYRRIATRRDGHSVIQTNATVPTGSTSSGFVGREVTATQPLMPTQPMSAAPAFASPAFTSPTAPAPSTQNGIDHGNGVLEQSGYLVQVYSARSNSPPFALTDHSGRTVAYVTPVPGVNLRTHLNSRISVVGSRGYLTGLNTPHIMVTQAVRTPE